jgi:hypothetical protein
MVFGKDKKVEDSKTIACTTTEGSGIHSCTVGDCATNPFSTSDIKEYEKHLQDSKRHYLQGAMPCAICGKEVNLNEVLTKSGNKAIHKECVPSQEDEL